MANSTEIVAMIKELPPIQKEATQEVYEFWRQVEFLAIRQLNLAGRAIVVFILVLFNPKIGTWMGMPRDTIVFAQFVFLSSGLATVWILIATTYRLNKAHGKLRALIASAPKYQTALERIAEHDLVLKNNLTSLLPATE